MMFWIMKNRCHGALLALILLPMALLLGPSSAAAVPTPGELAAMEREAAIAERQAQQEIEALFTRLCPGRCELIDVRAIVGEPRAVGEVTPGFDGEGATGSYTVELQRLEVQYLIDSTLPKPFMSNMPRMLSFRLQRITPDVRVTPIPLEFPRPQAPLMPEIEEEPDMGPPPKIEEEPDMAPAPPKVEEPEPKEEPKVEEEKSWLRELWTTMLPYLPYIMLILVIFGIVAYLLDWFREYQRMKFGAGVGAGGGDASEKGMPDVDELRRELKQSRGVQNEVMRKWIAEDPEAVAALIRMVGPDILDDLKRDMSLKAAITEVSDQAARQSEPLSPEQARRIAQEARARITAARVVQSGDDLQGDWEFVEGLSVPALQRIMGNLPARERSYALGKLPSGLRASYMEQMTPQERRELFVGAGSESALSRDEAIELASKLREASSEVAHLGSEGSGQAEIILDMLRAVDVAEQEDTLRELRRRRPEVAAAVLSSTLLESAIPQVPTNALADAMYRTPIEELTQFMRGTREDVRSRMLEHAPSNVRGAILQELDLDIPSNRGEYLDARTSFMATLATQLRREGEDLVALNARALTGTPSAPPTDA